MLSLYNQVCREASKLVTKRYSTSFSTGIRLFKKNMRMPIYGIYGFVRFADEIVDSFHDSDKAELLSKFREDTKQAIARGISLNPILQSFQEVVNTYHIEWELIEAFLKSMEMDLFHDRYEDQLYKEYIYGSAEVVGLMCLKVFTKGKEDLYDQLKEDACSLGSAFQKINFLRDMKSDYTERGRVYFPGVDFNQFTLEDKKNIEADIKKDFDAAYNGIIRLPKEVRLGVYLAYVYYTNLFKKISQSSVIRVKEERIRVPNRKKVFLLFGSTLRHRLNLF